jgi:hypothetical protein
VVVRCGITHHMRRSRVGDIAAPRIVDRGHTTTGACGWLDALCKCPRTEIEAETRTLKALHLSRQRNHDR